MPPIWEYPDMGVQIREACSSKNEQLNCMGEMKEDSLGQAPHLGIVSLTSSIQE